MECVLSVVDEGAELRALAVTPGGDLVGEATLPGPTNPRFVGGVALRQRLDEVVRKILPERDESACIAVAAAVGASPERLRDLLADVVPVDPERVVTASVERFSLAGSLGTPEPARAVVIRADIGSRGLGIGAPGFESTRGGFGELLGDDGSAHWIGREGMVAAMRAFEKRCRNTLLKARLLSHFGLASHTAFLLPDWEALPLDRFGIAGFAACVFEAAEEGDEIASAILETAGRDLATMALAIIHDLDLAVAPFSVLPSGSVFRHRGITLESFMKLLKNKTAKANLVKSGLSAAGGGALVALHGLGLKVRPEIVDTLRHSLKVRE